MSARAQYVGLTLVACVQNGRSKATAVPLDLLIRRRNQHKELGLSYTYAVSVNDISFNSVQFFLVARFGC
jgi:hypothetical protein